MVVNFSDLLKKSWLSCISAAFIALLAFFNWANVVVPTFGLFGEKNISIGFNPLNLLFKLKDIEKLLGDFSVKSQEITTLTVITIILLLLLIFSFVLLIISFSKYRQGINKNLVYWGFGLSALSHALFIITMFFIDSKITEMSFNMAKSVIKPSIFPFLSIVIAIVTMVFFVKNLPSLQTSILPPKNPYKSEVDLLFEPPPKVQTPPPPPPQKPQYITQQQTQPIYPSIYNQPRETTRNRANTKSIISAIALACLSFLILAAIFYIIFSNVEPSDNYNNDLLYNFDYDDTHMQDDENIIEADDYYLDETEDYFEEDDTFDEDIDDFIEDEELIHANNYAERKTTSKTAKTSNAPKQSTNKKSSATSKQKTSSYTKKIFFIQNIFEK